jgi:carboxynorspermidine decarboxylase
MPQLRTPYYLIDEAGLKNNLQIIRLIREESGAKSVLALKCFSTWCVFDLMRQYMDGITSSSLRGSARPREIRQGGACLQRCLFY